MRLTASHGRDQSRHANAPWRRGWLAFVYAVLLAFMGQACVTQTHIHFDPPVLDKAVAATKVGNAGFRTGAPTKEPAQCPICREIAHAGHYLPSMPVALVLPVAGQACVVAAEQARTIVLQRIRRWYSRGPPGTVQPR